MADTERAEIRYVLEKAVAASPLLCIFGIKVRLADGRFYIEPARQGKQPTKVWGRITPLDNAEKELLLEVPSCDGGWASYAKGQAGQAVQLIACNTSGRFHLLGSLDAGLRRLPKGQDRLPVVRDACGRFAYCDTGEECSVEETLFHYFGLPIEVVAQPTSRYLYYRRLKIVETSKDRTRVLVRYTAQNEAGEISGGTCLYMRRDGQWWAYTIKHSESETIAQAEAWLDTRKRPAQLARSTPKTRKRKPR